MDLMRFLKSDTAYQMIRWALGMVFLGAGGIKLMDPEAFAVLIGSYGLVPGVLLMPAAIGLPLLEIIGAIGLMADLRGALALVSGLLLMFMSILGYGIRMGLDVDCGCFSLEDPESRAYHGLTTALYRDAVMLMGVFYLYSWRFCQQRPPRRIADVVSFFRKGEVEMGKWMAWVLVGGLVAASHGVAAGDDKFEQELKTEQVAIALASQVKTGGYQLVSTTELKRWIDAKKDILIVDTMPYEDSYKKEHVPGAKQFLFPIPDMTAWDPKETAGKTQEDFEKLLGADKAKPIVIYCGFVKCTRSHNGAAWAVKLGYTNVYRHPGGIFAWKGAKYPTVEVK